MTGLLNTHIFAQNKIFAGIILDANYYDPGGPDPPPSYYFQLGIGNCFNYYDTCSFWKLHYRPRMHIAGVYFYQDTTVYTTYLNSTLKYNYDDENHKTTITSKLDSNHYKKTEFLFDSFYKIKQSRLYTSLDSFDSSAIGYNYLDLKSQTKDGRGNKTNFSYDEYLNLIQTDNADNSQTLDSTFYQNGLSYTFGNVPGLVVKKIFTDETGNKFNKYFDAVGNLRREVKYILENPSSSQLIALITDYNYDTLYRVTEVRTPAHKSIYYFYDGYGRQSGRVTPDAGTVLFKYDKNDNLRFSRDMNQANHSGTSNYIAFRGYDKLNRMLYSADAYTDGDIPYWDDLNPDNNYDFENYNYHPESFLTINVYDSLITDFSGIFAQVQLPFGYNEAPNFTIGNLCAIAYRTVGTEDWNYKFYRYDARGRVIIQWNRIDGFETRIEYEYNSANQVVRETHIDAVSNVQQFQYKYDLAGRLDSVNYVDGERLKTFAAYTYNENSQISTHYLANNYFEHSYSYNSRNWVTSYSGSKIQYGLSYFANGNISNQNITGEYQTYLGSSGTINFNYTYDKSNRLLQTQNNSGHGNYEFTGVNTYDYDGNFLSLMRSNNGDAFGYEYYNGTNRLAKISGSSNQFTYDYNGNLKTDAIKNIYDVMYDYRNLIIEFKRNIYNHEELETYLYKYRYDEAGNRILKITYKLNGESWDLLLKEYYSRDLSGKEIAVYEKLPNSDMTLKFYNVWGLSNEGLLFPDGSSYYYLKDHLGSIRAVYDNRLSLVSAQDYDPWGYELTGRAYIDTLKYKFTGKERDKESTYDYFGARYYDSRIGRWLQMEPLYDKYINFTPYLYSILNPIKYFDKNGMDIYLKGENAQQVFDYLKSELKNLNLHFNSETGEITLESKGDELTKAESKFLEALNNKDVIVNLNLTDKNTIETGEPFQVGAYEGCTNIEVNGKIYTVSKQTFNLEHAKLWEQVGGSSIGYSALHEIIESYLGAEGKNSIHSNLDIISKILHIETLKLLPEYTVQMVKVYVRINERLKRDDYWLSGTTDSKYLYSIYK
jgi:RHS repeat-associated protein